jgi:raffinose/stachyose/melibiose transport system permease protein
MKRLRLPNIIAFILITLHIIVVMFPFGWMLVSTFKTNAEFLKSVWALPSHLEWSNYVSAWGSGALGTYAINSLIVTLASVFLIVLIATLSGYALGIFRLKWLEKFEVVLILAMTVPAYVSLVPIVETLRSFSLLDTRIGVILPTVAFNIPVSVFIMRSFFVTVPREIIEAAKMDGANELQVFGQVIMPLARPSMFTVAIVNVIWVWNDFLFPLVLINSPKLKTLPVGLKDFVGEHVTNYPVMLAAIFIASLGAFLIYSIFQKQVISGLMGGAVKE